VSTPQVAQEHQRSGGITNPTHVQRIESGVVAVLAVVAVLVLYPGWWWVILAAFLVFDLSALGYLRSPAAGAASYNAVHNYAWPAAAAALALVTATASPTLSTWAGLLACAWAFHVGFDRAIGAGLKLPDAFAHTHLGWVTKGAGHSR
jgi:hypothetical protein